MALNDDDDVGTANQQPKKTYIDMLYDNLQHCNNYLTRHNDVNIVCCQPVCQYAAPLLGGIKRNAT